ncbi:hypothetical protein GX586_07635 [bacterium]|nr:hypothetical protein [bacterium]
MKTIRIVITAVAVLAFAAGMANAAAYYTGFEDGVKAGYALGSVSLSGVVWTLDNALIGSLTADKRAEVKSVRMSYNGLTSYTSSMYLAETLTGAYSSLSFLYADYGSYENDLRLAADISSDDGVNWSELGVVEVHSSDQTLTSYSTSFGPYQYVRVRFRVWSAAAATFSAQRVNVDNVAIVPEPAMMTGAAVLLAGMALAARRRR